MTSSFTLCPTEKRHHEFGISDITMYVNACEDNAKRLYSCYIMQISLGISPSFNDPQNDPVFSTSLEKYKSKLEERIRASCTKVKQTRNPFLDVNDSIVQSLILASCQNKQQEILCILRFEARDRSLKWLHCKQCHQMYMMYLIDENGVHNTRLANKTTCEECKKSQKTKKKQQQSPPPYEMNPIWIDADGNTQYNLPRQLQGLTLAEKL